MRTRVKICGITCLEDAQQAIKAGADALGFVFYPPSPRYVEPHVAAEIIAAIPPFVTCVGLFVDAPAEQVAAIAERCQLDLLQFHGAETEADCKRHHRPYIKALRIRPEMDVAAAVAAYPSARAMLLDSYVKGVPGGTGESFNWQLIPEALRPKIILAGGLEVENVASAVEQVAPYAVDVSGGVEREKGRKCPQKVQEFINQVAKNGI